MFGSPVLFYLSAFVPVPYYFYYLGSVMYLEAWSGLCCHWSIVVLYLSLVYCGSLFVILKSIVRLEHLCPKVIL